MLLIVLTKLEKEEGCIVVHALNLQALKHSIVFANEGGCSADLNFRT